RRLRHRPRWIQDRGGVSYRLIGADPLVIDHFNLPVSDLARSRRFYEAVLSPLGFQPLMEDGDAVGFGNDTWAFGIVLLRGPVPTLHLAFTASSRSAVD